MNGLGQSSRVIEVVWGLRRLQMRELMRTVKDGDLQRLSLGGWGMHLDLGGLGFYHLMINKIISAFVERGW